MSTPWHESQSDHNKDAYGFLHTENPSYVDWEVTTLFYAALHLVDGYFEKNGIQLPNSHRTRNHLVNKELNSLYPTYRKLYNLSLKARYEEGNTMQDYDRRIAEEYFSFLKTNIYRV